LLTNTHEVRFQELAVIWVALLEDVKLTQ